MRQVQIQNAIYQALVPTGIPVYDFVPQDSDYPYIVIGDTTSLPNDTDTEIGSDSTITIHVWSRYRGRLEVKQIQQAIYDILHRAQLSVSGSHFVMIDCEFQESFRDADGLTMHGVQRFRMLIEDLPPDTLTTESGQILTTEAGAPLAI